MKDIVYILLSRNAFKELGKYLVIMAICILLVGMLVIDIIGQELSPGIRHYFTGEKSRFEIDISSTNSYSIIEDWEDKVISVMLHGLSFNNDSYGEKGNLKGYLIDKSELQYSDGNTRLLITTKKDFKINAFMWNNNRQLILDVYFAIGKPDFKELMYRGLEYEKRQEYSKALLQYQSAQDLRPQDNNVRTKIIHVVDYLANADTRSIPVANEIDRNNVQDNDGSNVAGIDGSVQLFINSQNGDDNSSDDLIAESPTNNLSGDSETENSGPIVQPIVTENREEQITANIPAAGSQSISQIELPDDIPADNGMMIGFQELLRKTGTEVYVLIVMYSIVAALALVVALLARKLFKLHKFSNKQKQPKPNFLSSLNLSKNRRTTRNKKIVSDKHVKEVRKFAKHLSDLYSQSEPEAMRNNTFDSERKSKRVIQDHTRKIESVMKHIDKTSYDSESISLTKKYRDNDIRQNSTTDKYEAVRQLSDQNWEIWEIARELSMGTEEVKMALGMGEPKAKNIGNNNKYGQIYRLSDKSISPSQIASALHIGEEEVRLALKLREKQGAFV